MMKRTIALITCIVMLLGTAALAFADELPTVNEAIKGKKTKSKKTEVSLFLDGYDANNKKTKKADTSSLLILERVKPGKEFTAYTCGYAENPYETVFPNGYKGTDTGSERVWYRGDLMKNAKGAASKIEKAGILIVAENEYTWSGITLTVNYPEGYTDIPAFGSLEELRKYLDEEDWTITYRPTFGVYSMVNIYDTKTKKILKQYKTYTSADRASLVSNPEADEQWNNMNLFRTVPEMIADEKYDWMQIYQHIALYGFVDGGKQEEWLNWLMCGMREEARQSAEEYYWEMAKKLKSLDPSETNRKNYDLIIQDKSYDTLKQFVTFCNYSGLIRSAEEIAEAGGHMAKADASWQKKKISSYLKSIGMNKK